MRSLAPFLMSSVSGSLTVISGLQEQDVVHFFMAYPSNVDCELAGPIGRIRHFLFNVHTPDMSITQTANVLNKVPKSLQGKVKADLHEIWMAETKEEAGKAFEMTMAKYGDKYPKAIECLTKDREELLAFYSFPAVHWVHIRTSNPVESAFSTIRLRTAKTRNCGSRATTLAMVFKLAQSAEKRWIKLRGYELLGEVITGVIFKDGKRVSDQSDRSAA